MYTYTLCNGGMACTLYGYVLIIPSDHEIMASNHDIKTHDFMYSDYMIMVVSRTSPDPLETMGITTYAIRSTHALHGTYIIG